MSLEVDSTRLKILKGAVMAIPDVRRERVEALRQLVKFGKYRATDLQIAEALLDDLREPGRDLISK